MSTITSHIASRCAVLSNPFVAATASGIVRNIRTLKKNPDSTVGKKNPIHEHQKHIAEVAEMLIRSAPTFIIKKTMEERHGFKSQHVEGLIAKAKKLIRATDEGLANVLAQHIALGENLIWMALNKNDVKTAVTQFANMSKLRGLERSQVDVNHT